MVEPFFKERGSKLQESFHLKALLIVGFLLEQRLQSTKFSKGVLVSLSTNENICRTSSERPTEGGKKVPRIQKQPDKGSFFIPSNGKSETHLTSTGF